MKPLIIVESFTKTKTISKYLDKQYDVICSLGHINNLPSNELGIDTNTWTGSYVITNPKIVKNIRDYVKNTDMIYIASDPDMEGEAIAHHIHNTISNLLKNKTCRRIEFNEITKNAIKNAIENPRDINTNIVNAQETRRFVDRLVGFKLSPLLWNSFNDNTLSAGRVQSIALMLCINAMKKIKEHNIELFWNIFGYFNASNKLIEFKYCTSDTPLTIKYDSKECSLKDTTNMVQETLKNINFDNKYTVKIDEKLSEEKPSAPYITTTLQQDAYNKLKFSSKKTMQLAQQLYENGHITYMRTDSVNISVDFKFKIVNYVKEVYGENYAKIRSYSNKVSNAQEAHEAIRITNVNYIPQSSDDIDKLYNLIWKRTIASQMQNAKYQNIIVYLQHPKDIYRFIHNKPILIFDGYLKVYNIECSDDCNAYKKLFEKIKPVKFIAKANISNVPSLYNEVTLIKELEKNGIGRPSTYSSIVDKLITKKYVSKGTNPQNTYNTHNFIRTNTEISSEAHTFAIGGKNKDLFVPTEIGNNIIEYLQQNVKFLLDINFTSNMENAMDMICENKTSKIQMLNDFYNNHILPLCQNMPINNKKEYKSGIIKTKYGYCYYHQEEKRYTNIESYLNWKNKKAKDLDDKEIKFLASLPKILKDGKELHIGQYGLYLKENGKNIKLDKTQWDTFI